MLVSGAYAAWIGESDYHGAFPDAVQVNLRNLVAGRSARTPFADDALGRICIGPEGSSIAPGSITLLLSATGVAA